MKFLLALLFHLFGIALGLATVMLGLTWLYYMDRDYYIAEQVANVLDMCSTSLIIYIACTLCFQSGAKLWQLLCKH